MRNDFSNVVAIYRGTQSLSALYWGNKCKWRLHTGVFVGTPSVAHIEITSNKTKTVSLTQSSEYGVVVDWGDGTSFDVATDLAVRLTHTYAEAGEYDITFYTYSGVTWSPGATITSGTTTNHYAFLSSYSTLKGTSTPELKSFVFGSAAQLTEQNAFADMTSLISIDLPYGTTAIPPNTFNNCTALQRVGNFDAVTSVGDNAFNGCIAFATGRLPSNLQYIGANAFNGCISLPHELELIAAYIGSGAFHSCTQIDRVWLRSSVETLIVSTSGSGTSMQYISPFYACSSMVIYAEASSRPVGWDEHFNVYSGTSKMLTVIWNQTSKPDISLYCTWNAVSRVITWEDRDGSGNGYEYEAQDEHLTLF